MRSLICKAGLFTAAFLFVAVGTARAETLDVKVPFSFVVHGHTLPAGDYHVTNEGGLVQLRDEKDPATNLTFMAMPANGRDPAGNKPALTFIRHEHQYYLNDIWESGSSGIEPTRAREARSNTK